MSFSVLGLSDPLIRAASQYDAPTPVQSAAIPVVLAGGDLLATAATGSGKTAAFVLPLLQRWLASPRTTPKRVHTLILVPTRELAAQVREVVQRAIRVDTAQRTPLLRHLITTEGWKRVLVFVASPYSADHVADKLKRNGIKGRRKSKKDKLREAAARKARDSSGK